MKNVIAVALSILIAGAQPAFAQASASATSTPVGGPYIELLPAGTGSTAQGPLVLIRFPTPPGNFAPGNAGADEACSSFNYGGWKAWGGADGTNRLAWVICNVSRR